MYKKLMPVMAVMLMLGSMFAVVPVVAEKPTQTSPHQWDGNRGTDSKDCSKIDDNRSAVDGDGWIHWVFSTKGDSTDAILTLGGTGYGTFNPGPPHTAEAYHFYTPYFDLDGLTAEMTWSGSAGPGGGLVVSDYCPGVPVETEGSLQVNKTLLDAEGEVLGGNTLANELELKWGFYGESTDKYMGYTASGIEAGSYDVTENTVDGYAFAGYYMGEGTCADAAVATLPISVEVVANETAMVTLCNQAAAPVPDPEPDYAHINVEKMATGDTAPEGVKYGFEWECSNDAYGSFKLAHGENSGDIAVQLTSDTVWCEVEEVETRGAETVTSTVSHLPELIGNETIKFNMPAAEGRAIVQFENRFSELDPTVLSVSKQVVGAVPVNPFGFAWTCEYAHGYVSSDYSDLLTYAGYYKPTYGGDFTLGDGEMYKVELELEEGAKLNCSVTETETQGADSVKNNLGDGEKIAHFELEYGEKMEIEFTNTFEGVVQGDDDSETPRTPVRETGQVLGVGGMGAGTGTGVGGPQVDAPVGAVLAGGGGAASSNMNTLFGLFASLGLVGAGMFARRLTF